MNLTLINMRLRVLIIGPIAPPTSGCSLANKVIYNNLKLDNNIKVNIINTNINGDLSKKVGEFSLKKIISFLSIYTQIFKILTSDVVYTTPGQSFWGILKYIPFYFLSFFLKKPYIIHIHGNYLGHQMSLLKSFKKLIFSYFIKRASAGIVLSNSLKANFNELLDYNKIFAIENFAEDIYTSSGISYKNKKNLNILYLSTLMLEKGIIDLLDSLILLKESNLEFSVNIAGSLEDSIKDIFFQKFEVLGEFAKYHGVVEGAKKQMLLQQANVFILPTYYRMEGQPISLIEAMLSGNIIVTTNFSGIPDIVTEKNGFFVKARDIENISSVLQKINKNLPFYIDTIGDYNIKYAKSNFSEYNFIKKIKDMLNCTLLKR
ncbi:glycosyltransferase family 4 protein [Spirosoma gilvum]